MTVRLCDEDIDAIAKRVAEYVMQQKDVPFVRDREDWVSVAEAAKILKVSRSRIYQIKNKLTHRKGSTLQSRLFFKKSTLVEDYLNM